MKQCCALNDDPLSIIEEEARVVATLYGARWCDEAAEALLRGITARLGGAQVYLPRQSMADRRLRDGRIRASFNGINARELAREFQLSERTVRRILVAKQQTESPR